MHEYSPRDAPASVAQKLAVHNDRSWRPDYFLFTDLDQSFVRVNIPLAIAAFFVSSVGFQKVENIVSVSNAKS